MSNKMKSLLLACLNTQQIDELFELLHVPSVLLESDTAAVTRAQLAQAMNMILFRAVIQSVPSAYDYVYKDLRKKNQKVVLDHGAIRTVLWPTAHLPMGDALFARVLVPLGYAVKNEYPLPRLKMIGRAYCHRDFPQDIAQFFVSELNPHAFSEKFQAAVTRVLSTSTDPLCARDLSDLAQLARNKVLPLHQAVRLLPALVQCFTRQHRDIYLEDYETLLAESAEMAWIATEGNAFNHATDRVEDIEDIAQQQRLAQRPIKDAIETSANGRVRQTAFRAALVPRRFVTPEGMVWREVPGSFHEFISRAPLSEPDSWGATLDLSFDAGNATAIFHMTTAI